MAQSYVAVCNIATTVYCTLMLSLCSFFLINFSRYFVRIAKHFQLGHPLLYPALA